MKTPEEIKNALRMCSNWEKNCEECPYKPMKRAISCSAEMKRDSLTYIEQLEKRASLNTLRDAIFEDAVAHGLWDKTDGPIGCSFLVSEEATELVNAGNEVQLARWRFSDDETEAWGNYVEELADVIIASLSVAGKLGIDIDAAVRRKMEIDKARPWKHGKENEGEA